tara:strand:+ start:2730 stop:4208 length:1479 start_codon:yes stop_codon:yes gene_type:complete
MLFRSSKRAEDYWISVSDLMAGLMMVFLLIAVSYMIQVRKQFEIWVYLEKEYVEVQEAIYKELESEFKEDLKVWDADIDKKTLSVIFHSPDVMFEKNESVIRDQYQIILDDFFPRYIEALERAKYVIEGDVKKAKENISQIRIEGHASQEWKAKTPERERFLNNMNLSQRRSQSVLDYVLRKTKINDDNYGWVKDNIIGVGYSSAKPVFDEYGFYDRESSRRVEFKVVLYAQEKLFEIIQKRQSGNTSSGTDSYFETKQAEEETRRYDEKNTKEFSDLDKKLDDKIALLRTKEDEIKDIKKELDSLRIEKDNLDKQIYTRRITKNQLNNEILRLSDELDEESMNNKTTSLNEDIEDLEKEKESLKNQIKKLERDLQTYDHQLSTQKKTKNPNQSVIPTFIPYDKAPVPLMPIRPVYPDIAQMAGIEGQVIVQCFIDEKGMVKETIVLKGIPNTGLNESAVEAIRKTRFSPAKQRETEVGVWITIPINFTLQN